MIYVMCLIVFGLIGYAIGKTRENAGQGAALGLLLGPIGCLLALMFDRREKCPECKGPIPSDARRCRHCGTAVAPLAILSREQCSQISKDMDLEAYRKWKAEKSTPNLPSE